MKYLNTRRHLLEHELFSLFYKVKQTGGPTLYSFTVCANLNLFKSSPFLCPATKYRAGVLTYKEIKSNKMNSLHFKKSRGVTTMATVHEMW